MHCGPYIAQNFLWVSVTLYGFIRCKIVLCFELPQYVWIMCSMFAYWYIATYCTGRLEIFTVYPATQNLVRSFVATYEFRDTYFWDDLRICQNSTYSHQNWFKISSKYFNNISKIWWDHQNVDWLDMSIDKKVAWDMPKCHLDWLCDTMIVMSTIMWTYLYSLLAIWRTITLYLTSTACVVLA